MRKRFEQQLVLGTTPISEVEFPRAIVKSRDELPPILMALQHIFVTSELNKKVFDLLEEKLCKGKKNTGRPGMDLWQVFVLAVVRHGLGTNWDRLTYIANTDRMTRQIMGVPVAGLGVKIENYTYSYQTIIDNVRYIDEALLRKINELVVQHGQSILKKKEDLVVALKTDSYVLETNVYFPTDLRLSWDAARKCLDLVEKLNSQDAGIKGWRKVKSIRRNLKSTYRSTSWFVFKGRKQDRREEAVKIYLNKLKAINKRIEKVLSHHETVGIKQCLMFMELQIYRDYLAKFTDQIFRRLLKGEKIPTSEKVYSIFEPHTEWINKGKRNPNIELGHRLLITTDQFQFIADYKVMESETDYSQVESLIERLEVAYPNNKISSHSFDKGFFSKDNFQLLEKSKVQQTILPKKGKLSKVEKQREHAASFKKLRHKHSAIESNINMLEHHGLNRCLDRGLPNYKKHVGLSVLAYNLHILGNHLITEKRKQDKRKKRKSRCRIAA